MDDATRELPSGALSVGWVDDSQALAALGDEWNRLWSADARADVFGSFDWFAHWWRHFGHGAQSAALVANTGAEWVPLAGDHWGLRVCVARDMQGRVVAILPLVRVQGAFRNERGIILGTPVNSHAPRTGIVATCFDSTVAQAMAGWLIADPDWELLLLDGLSDEDGRFALLREALLGQGLDVVSQATWTHCLLGCAQDWAAMLESHARGFRKHLYQSDRSLARLGGLAVERIDPGDAGWQAFTQVDRLSWKAQNGETLESDARLAAHYRALFDINTACLRSETWLLKVAGAPAAVYLCLRDGRSLYTLKTSYSLRFAQSSRQSPSQVLLGRLIETTWQREPRGVDFVGNMVFVARWADREAPYSHLLLRRRRAASWLRHLRPLARRLRAARSAT